MYCPQCGTQATSDQSFCRACGANLKIIAEAVSLSETIAHSDRGPLPKIKGMMAELKKDRATQEVSRVMERINREIVHGIHEAKKRKQSWNEFRREHHIVKGLASLGAGIGIMIFLRYFAGVVIPLIPPEALAKIPFALEPVLRAAWLVGLIPTLSGAGRLIGGLLMRKERARELQASEQSQEVFAAEAAPQPLPSSVTENTTELLDESRKAAVGQS
jgi:hypothetical protein